MQTQNVRRFETKLLETGILNDINCYVSNFYTIYNLEMWPGAAENELACRGLYVLVQS